MDSNTGRWMSIKRFGRSELDRIHHLERSAEQKAELIMKSNKHFTALPTWETAAASLFVDLNTKYGPYWTRGKTEDERAAEIQAFERHIYPLWAPIFERAKSTIEAIHGSDDVIFADSYKINYGAGGNESINQKLGRVYAED